MAEPGAIIGGIYTVGAQVGGGANWRLFVGEDGQHNHVLIEWDASGSAMRLRGQAFSPPVIWWDECVVVYGYDGIPLRMVAGRFPGGRLPVGMVIALTPALIELVRAIHEAGFVHRNLGLGTICVAGNDMRVVGMRSIAEVPHVLEDAVCLSDVECMSLRGHLSMSLSRRDDLESVVMVLVLLCKGRLPWSGLGRDETGVAKMRITGESLCAGLPKVFRDFAKRVSLLGFDDVPPYAELAAPFLRQTRRLGGAARIRWEPDVVPPRPPGLPTLVIDSTFVAVPSMRGGRVMPVIDEAVLREWRLRRQGVGWSTFPRSAVGRTRGR